MMKTRLLFFLFSIILFELSAQSLIIAPYKVYTSKPNILIYIGGQSNAGTDPATGRIDFANMPSYLQAAYSNVRYWDMTLGGANTEFTELYTPSASNQMGWQDQMLYTLSRIYQNVYVVKRAVGGTKIATTGAGDSYPRSDFKNRAIAARAGLVALIGENSFDEITLWSQGESDAIIESESLLYETNLTTWINEFRTEAVDTHWIINKLGNNQIDFTYRNNVRTAQEAVAANVERVSIVTAEDLRVSGSISGSDFSHFNNSGAIELANNYAGEILRLFSRSKADISAPVFQSASVSASGLVVTLTYSEAINTGVVPFWRQWSVGTKTLTPSISGNTVILTLKSPIHANESPTVSYTKGTDYDENLQDFQGNEVADLSNVVITNNSTVTEPTITLIDSFDFSASLDGWSTFSGGTATFNETAGGETACAKLVDTEGTPQFYNFASGMVGGSVNTYRITGMVYMPEATFKPVSSLSMQLQLSGSIVLLDIRPLLKPDTWIDFEVQFLNNAANDDLLFALTGLAVGEDIYFKGIRIDRIQ